MMAVTLAHAVEQFYADYNRLPQVNGGSNSDHTQTTTRTGPGSILIAILRGAETESADPMQNLRAISYLEGIWETTIPGLNSSTTAGLDPSINGLLDHWGNPFRVILDADYNQEIILPKTKSSPMIRVQDRRVIFVRLDRTANFPLGMIT